MFSAVLGFIKSSQITIYIAIAALVAGLSLGFYISHKFHQAEALETLQNTVELSKKSVDASKKIENKIQDKKDVIEVKYITKTKEIIKYVPETIYKQCKSEDGHVVDTALNRDAVGVLNGDLPNIRPTDNSNAKGETITEIGLRELSNYILTIKKQYEELASEHDGLVDYNNEYQALIK